jgi:uncharacterized membrane protein
MDEQIPTPPAPSEMPEFTPPEAPKVVPPSDDSSGKVLAALGYLLWVIALVALLIEPYKSDAFVRFHAVQGLALGVVIWVLTAVGMPLLGLGGLIGLAGFVYQIYLAVKTWNGEKIEVPLLYDLVKSYI